MKSSKSKRKKKAQGSGRQKRKLKKERCLGCGILEGSKQDSEMEQGWIACESCMGWFHDDCAELNGIMDDNYFTCKTCCD